ncbi:hypothetical protein MRB53_015001 [Persea americana]|uniref:Uncharacterized protein n=1 Tax=Persea americana TaxID=3435 RepID=A0ACC2KCG8_PERAE|nr:hypothetical protein MRB53_015001 [Persea americana]
MCKPDLQRSYPNQISSLSPNREVVSLIQQEIMTVEELGNPKDRGPYIIRAAARAQEKKKGVVLVRGRGRIKRLIFSCIVRKVKLLVRCAARFNPSSGEA